jgi:hypothetical protein
VGATPPSSAHPDADLLTAFAERTLTERERARVIEHLAHCTTCRDVVYLAQPELETPSPLASGSVVPIRWFAWRRLQWAALAASVSLVVALAVLVRENPERSALSGTIASEPRSPQSAAQSQLKNDGTPPASTDNYYSLNAPLNEKAERRESTSAAGSPEKHGRFKTEDKLAESTGPAAVHGSQGYAYDGFAKLSPGVTKSATDDLRKTANPYDKEAAQKRDLAFRGDEKDTFLDAGASNGNPGVRTANGATDSNGAVFGLNQQRVSKGPAANMNAQNSIQNSETDRYYRDRNGNLAGSQVATSQPAPPPAPPAAAAPAVAEGDLKKPEPTPAEKGASMGGPVALARRSGPTRGVVPAEDVQKKKLETIPPHATPQGTEETVAVAGKAQDADAAHAATGANISNDSLSEFNVTNRNTTSYTLGGAATSAITDWRVQHGRLFGKLYGIWHNLILRKLQTAGETSVTEISSAVESIAHSEANMRSAAAREQNKVGTVSERGTMVPQHFSSVTSLGSDVWAVEVAGQGQNQLVVHHSHDAGVTWQPATLTAQEPLKPSSETAIKFKDAEQGEITLPGGEKWQTTDGGAHWNPVK